MVIHKDLIDAGYEYNLYPRDHNDGGKKFDHVYKNTISYPNCKENDISIIEWSDNDLPTKPNQCSAMVFQLPIVDGGHQRFWQYEFNITPEDTIHSVELECDKFFLYIDRKYFRNSNNINKQPKGMQQHDYTTRTRQS